MKIFQGKPQLSLYVKKNTTTKYFKSNSNLLFCLRVSIPKEISIFAKFLGPQRDLCQESLDFDLCLEISLGRHKNHTLLPSTVSERKKKVFLTFDHLTTPIQGLTGFLFNPHSLKSLKHHIFALTISFFFPFFWAQNSLIFSLQTHSPAL